MIEINDIFTFNVAYLASFLHYALETRWLGARKTYGIGHFYRNYMSLLEEIHWLGVWLISVRQETR